MPFGISSASEVWERTITEMFDDIPGVEVVGARRSAKKSSGQSSRERLRPEL